MARSLWSIWSNWSIGFGGGTINGTDQKIKRSAMDIRTLISRGLPISHTFLGGVVEAALYCTHRMIYMLLPSLLVISPGMGAD